MITTERHHDEQPQPSTLEAWWLAIRPRTLLLGFAPVAVGSAIAYSEGAFHPLYAGIALLVAVLIQVGANLANDYFDFVNGADTDERLGPKRAAQQGWIKPKTLKWGMILVFALAFGCGLVLVDRGGWPLLVAGIASIISGILYTGGPRPLGYIGLGDVFVLVFFGPVAVVGTHYVQSLQWSWAAFVASISIGLLATTVLIVNNLRDRRTDAKASKNTLAVRFGREFALMEYIVCTALAYTLVITGIATLDFPLLTAISLAGLILGGSEIRGIVTHKGAALNPHLGGAARHCFIFSILLSVGFVLG